VTSVLKPFSTISSHKGMKISFFKRKGKRPPLHILQPNNPTGKHLPNSTYPETGNAKAAAKKGALLLIAQHLRSICAAFA
jgi:hypothetical protein